jgi:hypothetical protein
VILGKNFLDKLPIHDFGKEILAYSWICCCDGDARKAETVCSASALITSLSLRKTVEAAAAHDRFLTDPAKAAPRVEGEWLRRRVG